MNTTKKLIIAVVALSLALVSFAGVTVAWLVAESAEVENTFSVGRIALNLTETPSDYKIVPGTTQAKDPTITVTSGSEPCFVYVLITNNLVVDGNVVGTPDINNANWIPIGTSGNTTLYRYKNSEVNALLGEQSLPVFTEVEYAETIKLNDMDTLENKTIVLKAYAHQSANRTKEQADEAIAAIAGVSLLP